MSLVDRDSDARLTGDAIFELLEQNKDMYERVVFAVDAPLQAKHRHNLPVRQSLPVKGSVERRACDEVLSRSRIAMDKEAGGARGWHPNIQPGAPVAPRINALINRLKPDFEIWTPEKAGSDKLVIECFPAEAIWAANRLGWFGGDSSAEQIKSYKKQKGKLLNESQVVELVKKVLGPFEKVYEIGLWRNLVDQLLESILDDEQWKKDGMYPGGKMLDDVVDTMLCLAVAIAYSNGTAHLWFDEEVPDDGHIIGPGRSDVGQSSKVESEC